MIQLGLKILLLVSITIVPLAIINFTIDPLQCFRQASWYQPLYDPNERVQSPCLVRSHDYDTLIIGASHVENFDPTYVDEVFGVSSLKTAIAGSTLYEQSQLLNLAFDIGKTRTIIWGLDTNILHDDPMRVRDDIVPFPNHIYNPNWFNNLLLILDPYNYKHYVKMAVHQITGVYSDWVELRYLNYWEDKFVFSKERTLEFFTLVQADKVEAMQNTNTTLTSGKLTSLSTENLDRNVIALVKKNPEIKFYIFFPPYSILRSVDLQQRNPDLFYTEQLLKTYLITELTKYNNVYLFDFQDNTKITFNLDNYKDLSHFSGNVNRYIIEELVKKEKSPDIVNATSTIDNLTTQVSGFDWSLIR